MSQNDLEPLPVDLQRLLRQGRPGDEPPAGSRQAVLAFVAAQAGALGAATLIHGAARASHAASAASRGAFGRSLIALKGSFGIGGLVVGVAAGTGVGAAGHAALVSRQDAPLPVVASPSGVNSPPSAAAPIELTEIPSSSPPLVAPLQAPPATRAGDAPSSAKDTSLRSEGALIDMARTAVARGQGESALAPLERHGREFPHGRLAEDREWLWIQALLLTGRTDAAKERAARFRTAFPRSLMLPALDQVLPSESLPPPPP
jgi:hypothetical protein